MDRELFDQLVAQARAEHPRWFALDGDRPPTRDDIAEAQQQLQAQLPPEYTDFVQRFGGGEFAFCDVYSLDPDSDLYIVVKNRVPWLSREDFVAISDNGTGDYYGFCVADGIAGSPTYVLDHESDELEPTGHADLYELLNEIGLQE